MKTAWNVVAVIAVVNILALGGVFVWLKATDRLSRERAMAVRERFAKTIAEENAAKAAAEAEVKAKAAEAAQAEKMALPPTSAAEKIAEQQFKDDQRLQIILRQQQELSNLRASLMGQIATLEEREKKVDADRRAFAEERRRVQETDGNKQFLLALSTLEGQKPKDAKSVLRALIDQKQADQVVAYLAKMEEGKRTKVIGEFVKDDAAMAADLLERLRTRGIVVPASSTPPNFAQLSANANDTSTRSAEPGR